MRPTFRKPTKTRAERFSSAFAAVGALVGSLPIGVTSKKRKGPNPAKLAVPVTAGAAALGVLLRRRKGKSDPQDTWSGYEAPPAAATTNATTVDAPVAPPVATDAVTTATEREKVEETETPSATDQPGVEGAVETAPGAGAETPAAAADLSNPETQSTS